MSKTPYGHEQDQCNCRACTLRRFLEGKETASTQEKQPAWMELLDDAQRRRVHKAAFEDQRDISPEYTILVLLADLSTCSELSALGKKLTDAIGAKDAPPFGADKMSKLRKQIKQLVDLI